MTATATVAVISAWLWTWGVGLPGGDSGESVAAIDVWGIAHAPGYFTYTTLGALFDRLVPVVDTVTTARSFSVVCTTAALVLLYRLAVALGVRRWVGAVTAAGFGVCTSVWFYATFPKHNALTLLFVVAILCCAHRVATDPRLAWTVGAGLLLGASIGVGWYAAVAAVPAVVIWVAAERNRRWGYLAAVCGAAVAGLVVVTGATMWRARAGPVVNWGNAINLGRFGDLVSMGDFAASPGGAELANARSATTGSDVVAVPSQIWAYLRLVAVDAGPVLAALAVIGATTARRALAIRDTAAVASLGVVNLVMLSLLVGVSRVNLDSAIIQGGYLTPTLVTVALFATLGLDTIANRVDTRTQPPRRFLVWVAAVLVVGSGIVLHHDAVDRHGSGLAEVYAADILSEVKPGGVLIIWGAENTFAPRAAQILDHDRDDVTVVFADGLARRWYREQLATAGLPINPGVAEHASAAACRLIDDLGAQGRAVSIDAAMNNILGDCYIGFVPHGLTLRPELGSPNATRSTEVLAAAERLEGLVRQAPLDHPAAFEWPNETLADSYISALIVTSNTAGRTGLQHVQLRLLETVRDLRPENTAVADAINMIRQGPP